MSKSNEEIIPQWIINHLDKFGNCSCGRDLVKRVGKENVIKQLEKIGFNCELRIIYENPKDNEVGVLEVLLNNEVVQKVPVYKAITPKIEGQSWFDKLMNWFTGAVTF